MMAHLTTKERLSPARLVEVLAEALRPEQAHEIALLLMERSGGRRIPRPRRAVDVDREVIAALNGPTSYREAAHDAGVPPTTAFRIANR